MDVPAPEEIKAELDGAVESLEVAEKLLKEGYNRQAVSESYYAVFYSARALLWSKGKNAKTHRGVLLLFSREFVSTGLIEGKYSKVFRSLKQKRELADYDLIHFDVSMEEAGKIVEKAASFIERVEKELS